METQIAFAVVLACWWHAAGTLVVVLQIPTARALTVVVVVVVVIVLKFHSNVL